MESTVVTTVATLLAAKMLADLLRRGYGYGRPNAIASSRRPAEIDLAYAIMLAGAVLAVGYVGPEAALPIAILMKIGQIVNAHILLSGNHAVLELLIATIFLRDLDHPAGLASAVQVVTVSVWLYAVFQKLYHGQFSDGTYFYVAFRSGGKHGRFTGLSTQGPPLGEYYAPLDASSQQYLSLIHI